MLGARDATVSRTHQLLAHVELINRRQTNKKGIGDLRLCPVLWISRCGRKNRGVRRMPGARQGGQGRLFWGGDTQVTSDWGEGAAHTKNPGKNEGEAQESHGGWHPREASGGRRWVVWGSSSYVPGEPWSILSRKQHHLPHILRGSPCCLWGLCC